MEIRLFLYLLLLFSFILFFSTDMKKNVSAWSILSTLLAVFFFFVRSGWFFVSSANIYNLITSFSPIPLFASVFCFCLRWLANMYTLLFCTFFCINVSSLLFEMMALADLVAVVKEAGLLLLVAEL